jgi:hypothetical protein
MVKVKRKNLRVNSLFFCALQVGALKVQAQLTPASQRGSPPVSLPFLIDLEGFLSYEVKEM